MANLDHEAIYEAYKSETKPVVTIDDTAGAFDADGNSVTLDNTKIANARASLNATAAVSYTHLRAHETATYLVCRLLL